MKLCLINNTYKVIVKNGVYSGIQFSYTLTINPTPADATVTFSTGTVSGNSCTVADGTNVTYTVSKTGYASETATVTVTADQTINVTLSEGHYTPGQVLYESSTGGASTTLNLLDDGKYQVICIAGGGSSYTYGDKIGSVVRYRSGGGGSGSGFDCVFQLSAGNYAIKVGAGAAASSTREQVGGDSQFGTCYARGGHQAHISAASPGGGAGGAAPTLTYTRTTTTLNKAGNNGGSSTNGATASGGAAVYGSYGKGANATATSASNAGAAGYVKVIYKGA